MHANELASVELSPEEISDVLEEEFMQLVDDALKAIGDILLFKRRLDKTGDDKHVATAS